MSLRNRQGRKWGGAGGGREGIRHAGQSGRQKRKRADGDSVNEVNGKNGKGENQSGQREEEAIVWLKKGGAGKVWGECGGREECDGEQTGQWVIRGAIRAC